MKIKSFKARHVFNGKGKPTIEVEISTPNYTAVSSVALPLSKSKYEYQDFNPSRDIFDVIENVNRVLGPELVGKNCLEQNLIDSLLLEIDGTLDRSNLGVSVISGISQCIAKLGAFESELPLFKYIRVLMECSESSKTNLGSDYFMPTPVITILKSGPHNPKNKFPVQEVLLYPSKNYSIFKNVSKIFNFVATNNINENHESLLSFLDHLIDLLKINNLNFKIGLDIAASRFYDPEQEIYVIPNLTKYNSMFYGKSEELSKFYSKILKGRVDFIEDPFNEDHFSAWKVLHDFLNKDDQFVTNEIVSDDLTATNINRLEKVALLELVNNVVVKVNQVGTVTEAINFAAVAHNYGLGLTASYRFGETEDDFLADFSVGIGADYIKVGFYEGSEYISKINRLIRIEELIS